MPIINEPRRCSPASARLIGEAGPLLVRCVPLNRESLRMPGMYEISVTERFVAHHFLRYPDGTTEDPHEHDWRVTVTYGGPRLDETGLLVDFVPLRARLRGLLDAWRHQTLNETPAFSNQNPTAELVATCVARQLPQSQPGDVRLLHVEVEEEPGCVARISPA
jgi:6-pyruvoyltetrahydropterin/6-carboxytetrahydropterin synthase